MEHGFNFAGGKTFPAHFIGQKLHAGAVLHLCRGVNPVKVRTKSDTANASDLFHMLHMCHHVAAKSLQRHFLICILQEWGVVIDSGYPSPLCQGHGSSPSVRLRG